MQNTALVIIDIQNDITKHYKDIIGNINAAIESAVEKGWYVAYIKHNNLSSSTRTFKPNTFGEQLVSDMKIVSDNIFTKSKGNALTSVEFAAFLNDNGINEIYIGGADATACVKSTVFNMTKEGFKVNVLSDCITSYDKSKIAEMLAYYADKGGNLVTVADLQSF